MGRPVTTFEWIQVGQVAIMGGVGLLTFSLRAGVKGGQWTASQLERLTRCEARLETGGQKMSDLTDLVQGFPDRLRAEFVTKELATERFEQNRAERQRLDSRIDALELIVHQAKKDGR